MGLRLAAYTCQKSYRLHSIHIPEKIMWLNKLTQDKVDEAFIVSGELLSSLK